MQLEIETAESPDQNKSSLRPSFPRSVPTQSVALCDVKKKEKDCVMSIINDRNFKS